MAKDLHLRSIPMGFVDFKELKTQVSIHQTAQYLDLKLIAKGDSLRGACPACNSSDRKLAITPSKGLFYCFAAKEGGDLIRLVAHVRGYKGDEGQHKAALEIDKHFGVPGTVPPHPAGQNKTAPGTTPPAPAKTSTFDAEAYAARLDAEHSALAGLHLSAETLKAFKSGYASTGLMRGRLALPMHDLQGNILGFCGRALDDKEPLLVFPKNFQPSSVVWNGHQVKDTDFAYLCRDPLDVIKAHEAGVENAVAALGAMTPDFLQTLSLWMEERNVFSVEPM